MISSGSSILEIASLLKKRGAGKIFICTTFGLFTEGMEKFDAAYAKGTFDKLLTTNLVYQDPELLARDYYISCDLSKYIALIIDTLNHDMSVSHLLNPADRIKNASIITWLSMTNKSCHFFTAHCKTPCRKICRVFFILFSVIKKSH